MFKKKEKKSLFIEYSSNRFLQSWLTLMRYLEEQKRSYLLCHETDTELGLQLVKEIDYGWVKDFDNFRWIRDFGELLLHVSKVLFLQNTSDNPVFAEKRDNDLYVYIRLPQFVVRVAFYSMGELGEKPGLLESWVNSDRYTDYVGVNFKRELGGETIFELDLEDNDNMAHNVKGKPLFDILTIGANDAIEEMYNRILDYTILTYYSITDTKEFGHLNWKDLLLYGL